jgi:AraC family transcriptional regulator
MADRTLSHEPPPGSLAICPAGIDCAADSDGSVDAIPVAVDPGQLALAAAEDSALEAQLMERLSGYEWPLLDTGFADQSHLSRWVRRIHGVPLTQLVA